MKLVLVVDDEAALLEVYATVVSDLGHRVLTANDGQEALALARAHQPDLIISDHMMPRLSGLDLLRLIRAEEALALTPFILVTAANPKGAEAATARLSKPVSLEEFERTVLQALQSTRGRDARLPMLSQKPNEFLGGEMLAWVSHEIKTPLSAARINLQLLQRDLPPDAPPSLKKRSDAVLVQLDRMNSLVASVLDAARLSEGRVKLEASPRSLKAFFQAVETFWRDAHPEQLFRFTLPDEDVILPLDEERARYILDNLLSNAVKYGDGKPVSLTVDLSPSRVLIHVTDQGEGIDASELAHLFDRFRRAEGSKGEGHGLGLYIAAASARLHGGALSVKSERGAGSTFTLALPLTG